MNTIYNSQQLQVNSIDFKSRKIGTVPISYAHMNGLLFNITKPTFKYRFSEDKYDKMKGVVAITNPQELAFIKAFEKDVRAALRIAAIKADVKLDCAELVYERDSEPCLRVTFPKSKENSLRGISVNGEECEGEHVIAWLEANQYVIPHMGVMIRVWYRQDDDGTIKAGFYSHLETL